MTIHEFVKKHGITMTARQVGSNPLVEADDWAKNANHYSCTLQANGREMCTPFSMGSACDWPTCEDVVNGLGLDASGINGHDGSFESWASEYGYSTDSRKAEKLFHVCEQQAIALEAFLGKQAYDELTSGDIDWL
jgi:hypothetical protein